MRATRFGVLSFQTRAKPVYLDGMHAVLGSPAMQSVRDLRPATFSCSEHQAAGRTVGACNSAVVCLTYLVERLTPRTTPLTPNSLLKPRMGAHQLCCFSIQ